MKQFLSVALLFEEIVVVILRGDAWWSWLLYVLALVPPSSSFPFVNVLTFRFWRCERVGDIVRLKTLSYW